MDYLTHEWAQPSELLPFHYVLGEYHSGDIGARIFHHTGREGALAMIKSRELWATPTPDLNDPQEIAHGVALIRDRWEEIKGQPAFLERQAVQDGESVTLAELVQSWFDNEEASYSAAADVFVACATLDERALYQYLVYGNYQLELDRTPFLHCLPVNSSDSSQAPVALHWSGVLYNDDHKRGLADATITVAARYYAGMRDDEPRAFWDDIISSASLMKDPIWAQEKEVRIIVKNPPQKYVHLKPAGHSRVVKLSGLGESYGTFVPLVTGCTVGPTRQSSSLSRAQAVAEIEQVASANKLDIRAGVSDIQFRDGR